MKREGWYMSDEDIVSEYNHALNKIKQIKIIADQNCKSAREVKKVLRENGVVLPGKVPEAASAVKEEHDNSIKAIQEKIDNSLVVELVKEEMCDKYCKFSDLLARASNDEPWKKMLESICEKCPLNRLG